MPNGGHFWNDEEDRACLELGWDEFSRRYNDGEGGAHITWNAYRQRRSMLERGGAQAEPFTKISIPAVPVGEGPENYIGPIIGYWDIETTYSSQPRVIYGSVADGWGRTTAFALDDPAYAGTDWFDDSRLVSAMCRYIEQFDIIVTWNGKLFDVPVVNGRMNKHRVQWMREPEQYPWLNDYRDLMPVDVHMHTDLMYYASGQFNRIGRRSLQSVSEYFDSPHAKPKMTVEQNDRAASGDRDAYQIIKDRGDGDVLVTRDLYGYLKPHIRNVHR